MKKLLIIGIVLSVFAMSIMANGQKESESGVEVYTLTLGHDQTDGHPYDLGVKEFAKSVEERTNGAVKFNVYPAGQLGDSAEQIEGLRLGTQDMALAAFSHVSGFVPEFDLFGAPFLFENAEHFTKVFDGNVGDMLDKASKDQYGIRLLSTFTSGYRLLFNGDHAVETIDDLKGLKIRVMGGEANSLTWSVFGAIPAPMPYSEVYSALQAGVVDGAENEPVSILMNKFYEPAPYFAITKHLVLPMGLYISDKVLSELPQDYQDIIWEEATNAAHWEQAYITDKNSESIEEMQDKYGVTVTYPDIQELIRLGSPIQDSMAKSLGLESLLKELRASK